MKTVLFDEQLKIKLHNKREENLYLILCGLMEQSIIYKTENTFGDRTDNIICSQNMVSMQGIISSMFFMNLIEEPFSVNDIKFFKDNYLIRR